MKGDNSVLPSSFIPEMTQRIAEKYNPLRIILFGSQARGDAGDTSDVDLLIVFPQVDDRRQMNIQIRRLLSDVPVCKDIFVTTPEEIEKRAHLVGDVLRTALREGQVLYEQS
jgi:predicted nucleotidyltransferase